MMDYSVFEEEVCVKIQEENEQEHMERIIKSAFGKKKEAVGQINDMLGARLCECSDEDKTVTLEFAVKDWMSNPSGTLHGGLLVTTADMAMGLLARYYKRTRDVVTVQLSVNFLRAVKKDTKFRVRAKAEKVGNRVLFMSAEIVISESGEPAGDVTAVFM